MKRILILIITAFTLLFPCKSFAFLGDGDFILAGIQLADHRAVIARKNVSGVSPDCSEDFNIGDTGDCVTGTNFDVETDPDSKLDIYSQELRFYASVDGELGYVREQSGCLSSETEATVKFTLEFEDVVDVHDTNNYEWVLAFRDSDSIVGSLRISTDANGDIDNYLVCRGFGAECSSPVDMSGTITADTSYDVYVYYKEDGATGEVAGKIGAWAEATTCESGCDDNSGDNGLARIYLGGILGEWGSGTTDTYLYFDDFEVYFGDQMP